MEDQINTDELTLDEKIAILMEELPEPVQDFLLSPERDRVSLELSTKYKLHADQAGVFSHAYIYMLLGVYTPDEFVQELRQSGITEPTVQGLTQDVNERVFKRLQNAERNPAPQPKVFPMTLPTVPTAPPKPAAPTIQPVSVPVSTPVPPAPKPIAPAPVTIPTPSTPPPASTPTPATPSVLSMPTPFAPVPKAMPVLTPLTPAAQAPIPVPPPAPVAPPAPKPIYAPAPQAAPAPVPAPSPAPRPAPIYEAPRAEQPAIRTMAYDMQMMAEEAKHPHPVAPTPSPEPISWQPSSPARSFQTSSVPNTLAAPSIHPPPTGFTRPTPAPAATGIPTTKEPSLTYYPDPKPFAPAHGAAVHASQDLPPIPPPAAPVPHNLPTQPPAYPWQTQSSTTPATPSSRPEIPIVKEYSVDPYRETPE